MDDKIIELMSEMELTDPATINSIVAVEQKLNILFPIQYKEFMLKTNGAEGPIGANSYLCIWPIEEIVELNNEYGVSKFTPGLIYFGSNGSDYAYAFDIRDEVKSLVEFPFDSIHIEDAEVIADSFNQFILELYNR